MLPHPQTVLGLFFVVSLTGLLRYGYSWNKDHGETAIRRIVFLYADEDCGALSWPVVNIIPRVSSTAES